ncbi:MAG: hypothetical protein L3K03_02980 [Thermoplasmata archaeon]|nr:hypothetical protein [Thermoplasmata archaeon]
MSGQLPWSLSSPSTPTNDPNELLRRIEQNTANTLMWTKITAGAVVLLAIILVVIVV